MIRTFSKGMLAAALVAGAASTGCGVQRTSCTEAPPEVLSAGGEIPLSEPMRAPKSLTVTSTDFADGAAMPAETSFSGFGCTGANRSPQLAWTGAPQGTQSFAIVVHDPDAPTGVGFFHWIVYDLPATTTSIAAGGSTSLPEGTVSGRTDFGATGYGGPCPPPGSGRHRYAFTVYALDVPTLGLAAEGSGGAIARFMLAQHTLAWGRLVGTFER